MSNWVYNLLMYYIDKGGLINLFLFGCWLAILFIATGRWIFYREINKSIPTSDVVMSFLRNRSDITTLPIWMRSAFSDWNKISEEEQTNPKTFENRFREILLYIIPKLDFSMEILGTLVSISPLLGLLGTVIGMVATFGVITVYGIGNPNLLSEGISVSLVTTQTGLLVAFPGLLIHNGLNAKKNTIVSALVKLGETTMNGEDNSVR